MTWGREKLKAGLSGALPVLLLALLLFVFLRFGPLGVFRAAAPPVEKVFIQRVTFSPEHISIRVLNDGPEPVTIAQLLINNVYWKFRMEPGPTLAPLQHGLVEVDYPWVAGDLERIALVTSTGLTFDKVVEVATVTPGFSLLYFKTFVLLGIYVGVVPVMLGLLWFPFLSKFHGRGYDFLLMLTIGLLAFLGFDAFSESVHLLGDVPEAYNGVGLIVIGFLVAVLTLSGVSSKTHQRAGHKGEHYRALVWGYLIALGIGLHNLGEGLAIGSSYAIGEFALGSTLVIGFMVHNLTEGVAIVAPMTRTYLRTQNFLIHLLAMGLLAGAPTIMGTLLGGFAYSPALAVLFLAVGAGAIFDVAFDILGQTAQGRWESVLNLPNVLGFLTGLLIMYVTGFLVTG